MEHIRIDPKFRRKPRPKRAGWGAREVFKFLLEVSAEFDLHGRFSPSMQDLDWLTEEWVNGDDVGREFARAMLDVGLIRLVEVGLVHRDGDELVITDWAEFYKPAKSGAQRTADYRERQAASQSSRVTEVTAVTKPVTCDATQQHNTALHSTKGEAAAPPPADAVAATGGTPAPAAVVAGAHIDRRTTPTGEPGDLQNRMGRAWFDKHGVAFDWPMDEQRAVAAALGKAGGDEAEVLRRWVNALQYTAFPICGGVKDLVRHWNTYGKPPPDRGRGRAPESAKYRAGVEVEEAPF